MPAPVPTTSDSTSPGPTGALASLLLALVVPLGSASIADVRPGHTVEVKGGLDDEGRFVASALELIMPDDTDAIVGTVTNLSDDGTRFDILGMRIHTSARTEWDGIAPRDVEGARVKVSGHYRGPRNFSAREIRPRGSEGRDRLTAVVDAVSAAPGGLTLRVMRFEVFVPLNLTIAHERPLSDYPLSPVRDLRADRVGRDDDDDIPGTIRLTEELSFGGQWEWKTQREDNYDLDDSKRDDRNDHRTSFRGEFVWEPNDDVYVLGGFRRQVSARDEEADLDFQRTDGSLTELYASVRDAADSGVDLQLGRQDFDEPREWLYDENLDGVRGTWAAEDLRVELSATTVVADGSPRNRDLVNYILYVSNNDDDRHLAAYVIDRRDREGPKDKPIHFGVRALGEWVDHAELWAEGSVLRGYNAMGDLQGYAIDVGGTWMPNPRVPFYVTLGYAMGSGDDDLTDSNAKTFRQTGFQDNNGKFGGVTSFRYYGEVLDPELANLNVTTVGIGVRPAPKQSIDLVVHGYRQAEAAPNLVNADIKAKPNGVDRELGWGWDLIYGNRESSTWDYEVVVGVFHPGKAFAIDDPAWTAAFQARCRF